MRHNEPIELPIPHNFDHNNPEHVKKAVTDQDFIRKVSNALSAGADEVVVTTKKEGPNP